MKMLCTYRSLYEKETAIAVTVVCLDALQGTIFGRKSTYSYQTNTDCQSS